MAEILHAHSRAFMTTDFFMTEFWSLRAPVTYYTVAAPQKMP